MEGTALDEGLRLNNHLRADRVIRSSEIPPPPYHVRGAQMLYFLCEFDRGALDGLLPPELQAAPTNTGMFALYSAPDGRGLTPYTAWFAGVNVIGHDTPEGNFATYIFDGCFSDKAGLVFPAIYNAQIRLGWTRQTWTGAFVSGEAGAGPEPAIRMAATLSPGSSRSIFGMNHYLGRHPEAGVVFYSVAISGQRIEVVPTALDILEAAPATLRRFRPKAYVNTFAWADCSLTFSPPRRLDEGADLAQADARRVMLLDALSRMGRSAVIVGAQGRMLHCNEEAEILLSTPPRATGSLSVAEFLSANGAVRELAAGMMAADAHHLSDPVALESAGRTFIVQVMRLANETVGEPAVLLLLTDLMRDQRGRPSAGLQLLGLTPGEARVAAIVGSGRPVKNAASELGITESTARSALKVAYEKLRIAKQSELAKIVARLEGSGF
jgi:DNA-binding CsgD family transcriptional regulator